MLSWLQLRCEELGYGGPRRSTVLGAGDLSSSPGFAAALVCDPGLVPRPLVQYLHWTVSKALSSSEKMLLLGAPGRGCQ